jgi:general stress protein 26
MTSLSPNKLFRKTPPTERTTRAYQFLRAHSAGVLSTIDPNGKPHGAVLYYGVDPSCTITFLTKKNTKKSDNLLHHNHAMFIVFDERQQTVVQVTGTVSPVVDGERLSTMFRTALRASIHTGRNAVPPVTKLPGDAFIGYELKPVEIRTSIYGRTTVGTPGKTFETIDIPR